MKKHEMDAITSTLGGSKEKPKSKKLKVHEISVRRGHKGGYIAKHNMRDEDGNPHHDSPEYPISTFSDLQSHMQDHMGEEAAEQVGKSGYDGE